MSIPICRRWSIVTRNPQLRLDEPNPRARCCIKHHARCAQRYSRRKYCPRPAQLKGDYSQKGYDFKPELAFSLGKTWLGDIGFTGRAYGLVDNTLSLDAGDVSIASLTFRPKVIIPIGADFVADTNTQLSFAPRLVCEQIKTTTTTSDCGTGGELGFSSTSDDGLSSADMRILLDRINGGTRSSFAFSVEHKF